MSARWHHRGPASLLAAVLVVAAVHAQPVALTAAQRQELYLALVRTGTTERAPPGFTAKIGDIVPSSIKLAELPASAAKLTSSVRCYDYAMLYYFGMAGNVVLLVEPGSRTIVDVIGPVAGVW